MKRILIFASGSGSNAENIIRYFQNRDTAKVVQVLTNNKNAKVIERSKNLKINTFHQQVYFEKRYCFIEMFFNFA